MARETVNLVGAAATMLTRTASALVDICADTQLGLSTISHYRVMEHGLSG